MLKWGNGYRNTEYSFLVREVVEWKVVFRMHIIIYIYIIICIYDDGRRLLKTVFLYSLKSADNFQRSNFAAI